MTYTENPTEQDFPLIDRCVVCEEICDWQPRYEVVMRTATHRQLLEAARSVEYVREARIVKICAACVPAENTALRMLIRKHYPTYAKRKGI